MTNYNKSMKKIITKSTEKTYTKDDVIKLFKKVDKNLKELVNKIEKSNAEYKKSKIKKIF